MIKFVDVIIQSFIYTAPYNQVLDYLDQIETYPDHTYNLVFNIYY